MNIQNNLGKNVKFVSICFRSFHQKLLEEKNPENNESSNGIMTNDN